MKQKSDMEHAAPTKNPTEHQATVAHTPAPWKLQGDFGTGFTIFARHKMEGDITIASVVDSQHPLSPVQSASVANARLIAAAPELLESLHIARGALFNAQGKGDQYVKRETARALQTVDAAIAKATGAA